MAVHDFTVPRIALDDGEPMVVSSWFLDEGTPMTEGDPVLEVETSKANMEVEAPRGGTLAIRLAEPGDTVSPGDVIALIADPGEHYDPETLRRTRQAESTTSPTERPTDATTAGSGASPVSPPASPSLVPSAPVSSSGPGAGLSSASSPDLLPVPPPASAPAASSGPVPPPTFVPSPGLGAVPSNGIGAAAPVSGTPVSAGFVVGPAVGRRREPEVPVVGSGTAPERLSAHRVAVGRLMTASAAVPQFSVQLDARVEEAERLVRRLRGVGISATFTDVLLKAAALTLARHPRFNAWLAGDMVEYHERVSISLATDGPAGVIAPVVHDVGGLGWRRLAAERGRAVAGAREGRLRPEHLTGGTFSISNVGPLGAEAIVPLLSPPQVAILGTGHVRDAPAGRTMTTVLVSDHRAVDGADAARFLTTFAELLGDPDHLTFADD